MAESNSKKNILYLTPFTQNISGADESLVLILRGLNKDKFNPFVVAPKATPYTGKFEEQGAKVFKLYFTRIKRSLNPIYLLFYSFSVFIEIFRFRRFIKKHKIDIVHTNMEVVISSGIAAKLCGAKSVYHYRHNAYDKPKIIYDLFLRLLSKISDKIFVISKAVGEAFYKRGIKDKVEVLYNVIEPTRFTNETRTDFFERNFKIDKSVKVVSTVGRINKRKNLEDFIRMANHITALREDARFFIVGDAHSKDDHGYEEKLKKMIDYFKLGKYIIFAGKQSSVQYVMKSSDIITISAFHEGFGRVVAEAMASEKPLVGCDSGAVAEVMDYCECGIVYPIGDAESFAKAVLKLLDEPEYSKRLGKAGLKRVMDHFTLDPQRKKIEEVYLDLVQNDSA